ncbi:hypothetical protein N9W17_03950 [Jannaschia sp.]|nr:hypothetical protein [Jannaschia sp.]
MSTSSPSKSTPTLESKRVVAPLGGAVVAMTLVALTTLSLPLMANPNTHLPADRLAEVEAMMR